MKYTGIELIAIERQEQIEKHGRTIDYDVKNNSGEFKDDSDGTIYFIPQLGQAASILCSHDDDILMQHIETDFFILKGWDKNIWKKMCSKEYKERLIIAGSLIAAEIDRIQSLEK